MKKIILIIFGIIIIMFFEDSINIFFKGINTTLVFVGILFFVVFGEIDHINKKIEELENNKMDYYNKDMDGDEF